jgi:RTX calcium-binding nonapeptide repeat (4 copies)
MNPISSVRRIALGAAVCGAAFAAVPALASASPCTYDPVHKVASVVDASGVNQLRVGVSNTLIFTKDGGNPAANCGGATTGNTDRINVFAAAKGASDGVVLDESNGAFAPGATPEADGNSEIELVLSGQSGHLSVFGTPDDDIMRVRQGSRAPVNNVLGIGADDDDDVVFTASDLSLSGGDGADFLSGQGFGFEGLPVSFPLGLSGGAGDDVIFGGNAVDHFSGNAGNDTLHTNDGNAELVSGGPGADNAVRDGSDTLFDVESSVFGSVGTLTLAPRSVTADAQRQARMTLRWTHPKSWRALRTLQVKLYRGGKLAGTIDVLARSRRLRAHGVEITADRSRVARAATTVTAELGMKFPGSLAGASLRVAVQATDRDGHTQLDRDAGVIHV